MSEPVRERLLSAIITAVGGEYGLTAPEDERDLPVTIVQDDADEATTSYDTTLCVMPLAVARAEAVTGATRALQRKQAHAALAAIVTAMHADSTFGGLATGVDYTGGGIQIDAHMVFAEAQFRVRYQHQRGAPAVLP
jgi:hypothetical protein